MKIFTNEMNVDAEYVHKLMSIQTCSQVFFLISMLFSHLDNLQQIVFNSHFTVCQFNTLFAIGFLFFKVSNLTVPFTVTWLLKCFTIIFIYICSFSSYMISLCLILTVHYIHFFLLICYICLRTTCNICYDDIYFFSE